jgi:hypothetical protein
MKQFICWKIKKTMIKLWQFLLYLLEKVGLVGVFVTTVSFGALYQLLVKLVVLFYHFKSILAKRFDTYSALVY